MLGRELLSAELHTTEIDILMFFHAELINPIALRMAKTPQSFGNSACNRVKLRIYFRLFQAQKELYCVNHISSVI